jgi:dethiobiotin synthetase
VRGLFVTGTDTGVGKTVVAGAICAALAARGERVAAFKPVVAGTDEPARAGWPPDHELLAAAAGGPGSAAAAGGLDPAAVAPWTFGPALSPHLAAELAGTPLDPVALLAHARAAAAGADALIAEGVGGALVPLTPDYLVRDLARDLALPVVIAARPGLGTINHTLLTLEALRAAGLHVAAVVMTPWPRAPGALERSNRETVARLGGVTVEALPELPDPAPATLAAAGARLPLDAWLGVRG